MARNSPKSAKCSRCPGVRIYPKRSKSTGKVTLQSGIRRHYWDKHRRVMMRGAKRQRKNPCRNKCKNPQFRYFDRKKYTLVSNHRTKAAANKKAKATRGRKYGGGAIHTVRARATKGGPSGWQVWKHVKHPRRRR